MSHISKHYLKQEDFMVIHKILYEALASFYSTREAKVILGELLTKTEKIMLAKRLAIISLLNQGHSIYFIQHVLKVSPSTVARIRLAYEDKKYTSLVQKLKTRKWDTVRKQIERIIPPRTGRDRFKHFLNF
jgi:uncharacterized protein YerC